MNEPVSKTFSKQHHEVEAIKHGTVIDHIPGHRTLKIAQIIAGENDHVLIGANFRSRRGGRKGVIKIADRELDDATLNRIALLAPAATINIIRDYGVVRKRPVTVPEAFTAIARCANPNCITNHEPCPTCFWVVGQEPLQVQCLHCERIFAGDELTIL